MGSLITECSDFATTAEARGYASDAGFKQVGSTDVVRGGRRIAPTRAGTIMTAVLDPLEDAAVLRVAGPLYAPACARLASDVRALLNTARRLILLNLAGVTAIDAGGVGALVHVYNMATAADAVLRITNASGDVRDLLTRVGILDLLNADPGGRPEWEASGKRQATEAKSSV
jgi:anti-anti-sigma factor